MKTLIIVYIAIVITVIFEYSVFGIITGETLKYYYGNFTGALCMYVTNRWFIK